MILLLHDTGLGVADPAGYYLFTTTAIRTRVISPMEHVSTEEQRTGYRENDDALAMPTDKFLKIKETTRNPGKNYPAKAIHPAKFSSPFPSIETPDGAI